MTSQSNVLSQTYYELSSLYKNPTRSLKGMAASNQDTKLHTELMDKHKQLLGLFKPWQKRWRGRAEKPALYFKTLSLLYEVDDYRGISSSVVEKLIMAEYESLSEQFNGGWKQQNSNYQRKVDSKDLEVRSLWKAKVLCCVAAIESKRNSSQADSLLEELRVLEVFIEQHLHKPQENLPAWTTLAFVLAAQARVARRSQRYSYMREKLLRVVECLDRRAAEIVKRLSTLEEQEEKTKEAENEIKKLVDDLVFIRRKQTLSTSFNVGLAEVQRGSLRIAAYACQAAQLEFRLHGQLFHRLFNELLMISIKRGQTSKKKPQEFLKLKDELEKNILPLLKPDGQAGNHKLYLYGLREKAVIHYYRGGFDAMLETLKAMEQVGQLTSRWKSRISNHRARAYWHLWSKKPSEKGLLRTALESAEEAFHHATDLRDNISSHRDAESLLTCIENSKRKNLIETAESLITYGDVQLGLRLSFEAIKSATVVIELCQDDNPRLLAMGHLVAAEAHSKARRFVEADQHLASAIMLKSRIDHMYVADRIRAIEQSKPMREVLDLSDCNQRDLKKAQDLLLGWFIEHRSHLKSVNHIAIELGISRNKINSYLDKLARAENKNSPYHHLLFLRNKQ